MDAVLASDLFKRAPSLRQILVYVCERYFGGEADRIKEYNIAVEAFGRGPDFDPNLDTIVRVEASRLRRRLKEYYAAEGASHEVQVILPTPGYIPQFVHRPAPETPAPAEATVEETAVLVPDIEPVPPARRSNRQTWVLIAAGIVICGGIAGGWSFLASRANSRAVVEAPAAVSVSATPASVPAAPVAAPAPVGPDEGVRILAGMRQPQFVDSLGHIWLSDRYFNGGRAFESVGANVIGVMDPIIYRTARRGDFRYDIPLKPGVYELRLLFIENVFGKGDSGYSGEASRIFHVSINGVRRLESLDILADAGAADIPADRVFTDISPAADGYLHLAFTSMITTASLSGIEIVPGLPHRMRPVRIACGARSYFDRAGQFWGADRYFIGGRPTTRTVVVTGTDDPELYASERWGRFTYAIPVAPDGRYRVTLKFAENYYGPSPVNPGRTGPGSRIFDVYANGLALLRDFDILKEAKPNAALDKVFRGLMPSAQGKLVFSFVPIKDYAAVHSIEIFDERP